jgi:RHS repeat-associated protein
MQSRLTTLRPTLEMAVARKSALNYEYSFEVSLCRDEYCSETTLVASSGWIDSTSWQVPSNALVWSATYVWSGKFRDNPYYSELFPSSNTFATTVVIPAGTSLGLDGPATRVAGVSLDDRHFEHSATDGTLPTAGVPLAMTRNYSSSNAAVGAFGLGWSSVLDMALQTTTARKIVTLADGHQVAFGRNADGTFSPAAGSRSMSLESCSDPCTEKFTDGSGTVFNFGAYGVTSVHTQDGQITKFNRTDLRVTDITDTMSQRSLKVTWSGSRVTAVDLGGAPQGAPARWRYAYNGDNLAEVCRPAQEDVCTSYRYTGTPAKMSAVITPRGTDSTAVAYDGDAVTQVSNANGTQRFATTAITGGKRVAVSSRGGATDTYQIDGFGRTRKLTNSRGGVELWAFNGDGQNVAYQPAEGSYITFAYDSAGRLDQRRTYPEHGGLPQTQYYEYVASGAAKGRPRFVTSPVWLVYPPDTTAELREDAEVEYEYDSSGRISKILHGTSAGTRPSESYTYTTGDEDAAGGGTMPVGLIRTVTDASGALKRFSYTKHGQLAIAGDALGAKTAYSYDWAGRLLTTVKSGAGVESQTTTYTYTDTGLVESVESPSTTNVVSGQQQQLRTTFERDPDGNVVRETSRGLTAGQERSISYELDPFGRVLSATDADGVVLQRNSYDNHGNIVARTDADGRTVKMTYTPENDLARQVAVVPGDDGTESEAALESYTYDTSGRVLTATDRSGTTRQYAYYMGDRIQEVRALNVPGEGGETRTVRERAYSFNIAGDVTVAYENGITTEVAYDNLRRPVSIITNDGSEPGGPFLIGIRRETRLAYDLRGLVVREEVMGSGTAISVTTNAYDAGSNLVRTSVGSTEDDPARSTTRIERDTFGRVISATDPRSTTETPLETRYGWDNLDRLVTETSWSEQEETTSQYGYDAFGNLTQQELPSGARIDRVYDAQDLMTSETQPYRAGDEPAAAHWQYTPGGLLREQVDPVGVTSSYEYDALGQSTSATRGLGEEQRVERYAYDDAGNPVRYVDPEGTVTTAEFDWRGNMTQRTQDADGLAARWQYEYDELGRLTAETSPEGEETHTAYNALDEITSITSPTGQKVEFVRDPAGRVVEQRDSDGAKTWINYDYAGNPVRMSLVDTAADTVLRSWGWTYDAAGLPTRQVDPLGGVREFGYDQHENLARLTYEDDTTSQLEYGPDGNPTAFTDQRGNKSTATYTPTGQLATLVEPAVPGATEPDERTFTWEHDALGRETEASTPDGVTTTTNYTIDGQPSTVTATDASGASKRTYTYDAAGRMTGYSHPDGTQGLSYDGLGNLTGTEGPAGDSTFTYDLDGRMLSKTDASGTSTYSWGVGNQLATAALPGGDTYEYQYDGGDLVGVDGAGTSETLQWDLLGNLTAQRVTSGTQPVMEDTYTYDDAGNRLSIVSTRDQASTSGYEYDLRNRLTAWTDGAGDHTAQWDAANNLVAVDGQNREYNARNQLLSVGTRTFDYSPGGQRTRSGEDTYTYDRFGQLTSDGQQSFAYDGVGRMVSSGQQELTYTGLARDPSTIGETITTRDPLGGLLEVDGARAVSDTHGDLIAMAGADGVQIAAYDPFGQPTQALVEGGPGFQGDTTSGSLVNMDARWYDSSTGTFMTRDDIALPLDEQNRYGYAMSNPVRYSDPTGHCAMAAPVCAGAGWGGALGGVAGAVVGGAVGLAVVGATAWGYEAAGSPSVSMSEIGSWSYTLPGRTSSGTSSQGATTSAALTAIGTATGLGAISVPDLSMAVPRTYGNYTSSVNAAIAGATASFAGARAAVAGSNAYVADARAAVSQANALVAQAMQSIAQIKISIPRIDLDIPIFGIDRPSWAYPDPFVAGNVRPIGQAAGGVTAALCGSGGGAACSAAVGALGASCAVPGSGAAACAPAVTKHQWAAVPEAGGTAASGAASSAGAAGARMDCGPGQTLTELGCEDQFKVLLRRMDDDEPWGTYDATGKQRPDETMSVGKYAVESIPARSTGRNWRKSEIDQTDANGYNFGCHTCGIREPGTPKGTFIKDHQPPSSWMPEGVNFTQRLYPQCKPCSDFQGKRVRELAPIMKEIYRIYFQSFGG